tara:strand:+ start:982 stop:1341 length:360 start_codon:yes stop_codon:yes gene_type:complete
MISIQIKTSKAFINKACEEVFDEGSFNGIGDRISVACWSFLTKKTVINNIAIIRRDHAPAHPTQKRKVETRKLPMSQPRAIDSKRTVLIPAKCIVPHPNTMMIIIPNQAVMTASPYKQE